MSRLKIRKLNHLVGSWPRGAVYTASWLTKQSISNQLLDRYKKSGWVDSLGNGAVKRANDEVNYRGGLYALQIQLGSSIHIGGRSALALQGRSHFLQLGSKKVCLFGDTKENLPTWFKNIWADEFELYKTSFLPPLLGMADYEDQSFTIKISGSARAIMESLYLTSDTQNFQECHEIMEGLTQLRPTVVQELLESCTSVKVKRLFLYLAKKSNQPWFEYLNLKKVNLGSGKRHLFPGGVYNAEFQITVPKD